mgnify:CR=1 FL=1
MTEFQKKVREVVKTIPPGKVMTYGQVAKLAGSPKASRAVGNILAQNFDPQVPCHRVIKADGSLGSYNRGIKRKQQLLKEEGYDTERIR